MSEDQSEKTNNLTSRNLARRTHEMMLNLALTDTLTGLYNRRGFNDELKRAYTYAKRFNEKLRLIFMDADDFKKINKKYTRPVGDEALISIAKTVKQTFRRALDVSSRWGGDEFVVIAPALSESIKLTAENIETTFNENLRKNAPGKVDPRDLSVSVGIIDWDGISSLDDLQLEVQQHMDLRKENKNG